MKFQNSQRGMVPLCIILILMLLSGTTAFAGESSMADTSIVQSEKQIEIDAEDGTHTVGVTLEGGSGRASIMSPAKMIVRDKKATILIEWSSSNYDYMVLDGITYNPINTEGNSIFELPVTALDQPIDIIADTTAMSVPHEVEYKIVISSSGLAKTSGRAKVGNVIGVALALIIILLIIGAYLHKKKVKKL